MVFLLAFALAAPPEFPPIAPADEARRDALTRYGLGIQTARNERLAHAAKQFQAAAERDPKAAAPHRELARVYYELGRDASAIREARAALALDADDYATAQLLGKMLMEGHKYADAAAAFRTAVDSANIAKEPLQLFAALRDLARAATKANDAATAETAYLRALALASKQRGDLLKPGVFDAQDLDRRRVELYEGYGESQLARKKFDSAAAAFETARDLSLDKRGANLPAGVARIHLNLSKVYAEKRETAAAIAELGKYLAFLPAGVAAYERYVELLKAAGRGGEVLPALRSSAKANPKNLAIKWLIAAEQLRGGEMLVRVATLEGGDAEGFRVVVRAYLDTKKYAELLAYADDLANDARGTDPEEIPKVKRTVRVGAVEQVRFLHAAIKAERGHTQALVRQLTIEFAVGRMRTPETLELLNYLAFRDGVQTELADALRVASSQTKVPLELFNIAFEVFRERRSWAEVITLADKAKESPAFKGKLGPYFSAANAHAELGDERAAMKEIEYVVSHVVADGRLGAMIDKARLLNMLGKPREALKLCADVRAEFPAANAQRRAALIEADSFHRLKENLKAEGLLRDLLADDPDAVLVLNNLGYHLADQSRKLPEAETMIRRAIELDRDARLRVLGTPEADRGTYLDSLGWVLFRRGELEQARELLMKATQLPDSAPDALVWDHLGDVQYRLKQTADAKQSWRKAVELYQDSHMGREAGRLDEAKRKLELP